MAKGVYKLRSEKIRSPGSPPPADSVFLLKGVRVDFGQNIPSLSDVELFNS